jgi:hypothetical protein
MFSKWCGRLVEPPHSVQVTTLVAPSLVMTSCINLKLGVVLVSWISK